MQYLSSLARCGTHISCSEVWHPNHLATRLSPLATSYKEEDARVLVERTASHSCPHCSLASLCAVASALCTGSPPASHLVCPCWDLLHLQDSRPCQMKICLFPACSARHSG